MPLMVKESVSKNPQRSEEEAPPGPKRALASFVFLKM